MFKFYLFRVRDALHSFYFIVNNSIYEPPHRKTNNLHLLGENKVADQLRSNC